MCIDNIPPEGKTSSISCTWPPPDSGGKCILQIYWHVPVCASHHWEQWPCQDLPEIVPLQLYPFEGQGSDGCSVPPRDRKVVNHVTISLEDKPSCSCPRNSAPAGSKGLEFKTQLKGGLVLNGILWPPRIMFRNILLEAKSTHISLEGQRGIFCTLLAYWDCCCSATYRRIVLKF